jgi:TolB-like protein
MLTVLAGCGANTVSKSFIREGADLRLIQKVAVLPFEGGGRASRIRELAITQLLADKTFDVVDRGRVDIAMKRESLSGALDVSTIRRLGESLDVQAVLLGSVEQEKVSRGSSSFPELTLTLRLIDCESGQLLWQASGRGSGYSVTDRLFGFAPKDIFEVTLELLEDLFATMFLNTQS